MLTLNCRIVVECLSQVWMWLFRQGYHVNANTAYCSGMLVKCVDVTISSREQNVPKYHSGHVCVSLALQNKTKKEEIVRDLGARVNTLTKKKHVYATIKQNKKQEGGPSPALLNSAFRSCSMFPSLVRARTYSIWRKSRKRKRRVWRNGPPAK